MRYSETWNACSQQWSTKRAQFFMTTPDCTSHNQCFKSWINWTMKFCLICRIHLTSHQPTTTSSMWQLFAGKMLPQPAEGRTCFPRVCQIPKCAFLCYRNKLISCWQKCVDCNSSILINKDVSEPSYNNLKFTVQNCNYFCTNLILKPHRENGCSRESLCCWPETITTLFIGCTPV